MNIYTKTLGIFVAVFLFHFTTAAQRNYDIYWVSFKNKKDSPYSIFHPQAYLSARAIERRTRYQIPIDSTDLPVNPQYISQLLAKGYKIHNISKWLNGVAVITESAIETPEDLLQLDFVKAVFPIGFQRAVQPSTDVIGKRDYTSKYKRKDNYYGLGKNQITMLKGEYLHKMGFEGQDMHVAITDGGFEEMRETPAFDSLFLTGRLLGTHDYVEGDDYVFESTSHGRDVASCMVANLPNLLVGTSPQASFYLFKTEDVKGEYVIEEYNWAAAVEDADSLGVDVINSSLGYYNFDDKSMNYAYEDINGKKSAMTKIASYAAQKGMLVVTSAGNEGNDKWKYITVPGDADSVLTVGAVDRDGYSSRFSSFGFEDRDLIKPNLVARGTIAVIATPGRYETGYNNGTSFSSPIMAGMVTSFWQAFPNYSNMEIIRNLQDHANRSNKPNNSLGYGIPNFFEAYKAFTNAIIELKPNKTYYSCVLDDEHCLDIFMENMQAHEVHITLVNPQEQVLWQSSDILVSDSEKQLWYHRIPNWKELPDGIYFLYIQLDDFTKRILMAK